MRRRLHSLADTVAATVAPFVYRVAPYVVLSLFDDPAMLALAFC